MKYLHTVILLLISISLIAQKVNEEEIFTAVEQQAEFPGGMGALGRILSKNSPNLIKEYNAGLAIGKINIQLIIEKDGSVSNIEILKNGGMFMETESDFLQKLKIIFSEKWKPAMNDKKHIRSKFIIPLQICF
jgi:periplasmic protein TonB